MEILKNFIFEEIEEKIKNDNYSIVYLNYDKANGIKILSNLQELNLEEKKNFYKIYIFNDEYMLTIYNFGEEVYKYTKILKEDFDEESIKEKYVYLTNTKEEKLKVRVGNIDGKEVIQYCSFIVGER